MAPAPDLAPARAALRDVFGFEDFRPGQADVLAAIMAGRDALVVMPTGGGKSLCYQLPAVVRGRLTVVVSPLVALMRDQVAALRAAGVAAASLNSANTGEEMRETRAAMREGRLRLLYVAPERLARADALEEIAAADIALFAIDEAHCVSEWGHDFRPDYMALGEARAALGRPQTMALTATADPKTREDVRQKLFDAAPDEFVFGFDRPNLFLRMKPRDNGARELDALIARHPGESGIVYCATRKRAEETAARLAAQGLPARAYHAGMDADARAAAQDEFTREDGVVMAATVAFGMGVDKPDVRFVAHLELPKTMEAWWQEIGRAGRDGLPAETLTLYGLGDIALRRRQIAEGASSPERKRIEHGKLDALISLAETVTCRRARLLVYFGETDGGQPCGACDVCVEGVETVERRIEAQKALSAVLRTGQRFGSGHLINILRGSASEAVAARGHDLLPTFGVGADLSVAEWRAIYRALVANGALAMDDEGYGTFAVTERGWEIVRGRRGFETRAALAPRSAKPAKPARAAAAPPPELDEADAGLLAALKRLRRELAAAQSVPAYVVFPDRSLIGMAARRPKTPDEMREVHGVGEAKLARYGDAFLDLIAEHG